MEEVSNKTIVALLAIALVVTVVGTVASISKLGELGGRYSVLTGAATTGTGSTNLTLAGTVAINVDVNSVSFGSGYVTEGSAQAKMSTLTPNSAWANWTNTTATSMPFGLLVNNTGTTYIRLNITSTTAANAEAWLCTGGVCTSNTANLSVGALQVESGSCTSAGSLLGTSWTNGGNFLNNAANTTVQLCSEMDYNSVSDALWVYFNATVPNDAGTGAHSLSVTFTAVDSTT